MFKSKLSSTQFILFLLIANGLFSCTKKKTEITPPLYESSYKQAIIDSRNALKSYMFTSSLPGLSVAISIDGQLVWSEGMGSASKELNVAANRDTKYRIGSVSRVFTTFLIAKQQEDGLLNVDSSFYKYIPKFPKKRFDFTPHMLAAEASGFVQVPKSNLQKNQEIKTLKDFIVQYDKDTLLFEPGRYYYKSDYDFGLLGILAEQVGKNHFSKLMQKTILDTLHLKNTTLDYHQAIIPNRSAFYDRDYIARVINAPAVNLAPYGPALGILTTADDLNKLAQQLLKPGYFSQKSLDLFYTSYKLKNGSDVGQGFGWIIKEDRSGRQFLGAVGTTIGGGASVVVFPKQKLVISICSNLGDEHSELPSLLVAQKFMKVIDPRKDDSGSKRKGPQFGNGQSTK
ncbi:MAG TPA: serine hydrolase domain-containing protein [Sunxiuqinia sp.]|nr:serine hydrolase domain-containing protein [Sunxiuqinia sp.]